MTARKPKPALAEKYIAEVKTAMKAQARALDLNRIAQDMEYIVRCDGVQDVVKKHCAKCAQELREMANKIIAEDAHV